MIYNLILDGRGRAAIGLCLLSPMWKSPSNPVALMNSCRGIASELMPLYLSKSPFILDTTTNHALRDAALDWLQQAGPSISSHVRRLRVVHRLFEKHVYEIEVNITANHEVEVIELKGGIEALSTGIAACRHRDYCLRVGIKMVEEIQETLEERISTNGTGGMGVQEFKIILRIIDHHMAWFKQNHERRKRNTRPRPS